MNEYELERLERKSKNAYRKERNGSLYLVMEKEMKMTEGMEKGRRGRNNQKWQGLEHKGKNG